MPGEREPTDGNDDSPRRGHIDISEAVGGLLSPCPGSEQPPSAAIQDGPR
jgi:hypothetical protein